METSLPAISRDSSFPEHDLRDLCVFCTGNLLISFFLVALWTLERHGCVPREIRGCLDYPSSISFPARSYDFTVDCPCPLGGDKVIALYELCRLKIEWASWNTKGSPSIKIKTGADCRCSPLDRRGAKRSLKTQQKDWLTAKKNPSTSSKRQRTSLEKWLDELKQGSSSVNSSSPKWIPINLNFNSEAHAIIYELVSSVSFNCRPLDVLKS